MATPPKKAKKHHSTEVVEMPQMPFDDALRRILSAPPQHKMKKKKGKKK
jgi:hypothetical protein